MSVPASDPRASALPRHVLTRACAHRCTSHSCASDSLSSRERSNSSQSSASNGGTSSRPRAPIRLPLLLGPFDSPCAWPTKTERSRASGGRTLSAFSTRSRTGTTSLGTMLALHRWPVGRTTTSWPTSLPSTSRATGPSTLSSRLARGADFWERTDLPAWTTRFQLCRQALPLRRRR